MSLPSIFFHSLLKTLADQLLTKEQDHAECIGGDFGTQISDSGKQFFSIYVVEEDLPGDLAALMVLGDNTGFSFSKTGFTIFMFIDSTKKLTKVTDDFQTIFEKMVLSHETCHFVFYYELYFHMGNNLSNTVYSKFKHQISTNLEDSITEVDDSREVLSDEHKYSEFLRNFFNYPNSHYDKRKATAHDFSTSNLDFFIYLTSK